ncbi:ABC transporter ATP-binding protein [Roseburia hominis]
MKKYIIKILPLIVLRIGMSGCYSIVNAGIPFIIKLLLDGDFLNAKGLIFLCTLYLAIVLAGGVCEYISQRAAWRADRNFYILIRRDVFDGMLDLDFPEFQKESTATYISTLNNDISEMQKAMENVLMIIESSLHILAYGVCLAVLDVRILVVVLIFSGLASFLPGVTGKELSARKKRSLDKLAEYLERAQDILMAFTNVNRQSKPYIMKHYDEKLVEAEDSMEHYGKFRAFSVILNGTTMFLIGLATFGAVGVLLVQKEITIGTAAAALSYVDQFVFPVRDILNCIGEIMAVKGIWSGLGEVMNRKKPETKEIPQEFDKGIEVSQVSAQNGEFHLGEVSFVFEKNKKYAVTGGNGSGKSTFLKVLEGRLPYESGKIRFDRHELRNTDISQICEIIEQNQHVYDASIEDNITLFGCYDMKESKKILGGHPKVQYILQQENAKSLSGGEKQLVIIMKALASNRKVILMDEALSAVDTELSEYIMDRLLEMEDRTIIAITHNTAKEHLEKYSCQIRMADGKIL